MNERDIQDEVRIALGKLAKQGVVFFRNNVGVAKHFDPKSNRVLPVRYGLANGSADLIGCVAGRFVALEVKRPGESPTEEQKQWAALVRSKGGVAEVVRSADEALAVVRGVLSGGAP